MKFSTTYFVELFFMKYSFSNLRNFSRKILLKNQLPKEFPRKSRHTFPRLHATFGTDLKENFLETVPPNDLIVFHEEKKTTPPLR